MKLTAHVYLLKKGKKVVYVGCTMQPNPFIRIKDHFKDKDFDSVLVTPCDIQDVLNVECSLIRKYNPKYNFQHAFDFRKPKKP